MSVRIEMPDTAEIVNETNQLVTSVQANFQVVTQEDYISAGELLKVIKGKQKRIVELFKEPKESAFQTHRKISAAEKELLDPLNKAEAFCKQKVAAFLTEQERIRREEAARRQAEADAENKRLAEEARKKAEDEKIALAAKLETAGFREEAEKVIEKPIVVPQAPIVIAKPVEIAPAVQGVSGKKTYKAEVVDLMALVRAVYEGRQPISLLLPNQRQIDQMAAAMKMDLRIDGVVVVESLTISSRSV